MKIDTNPAQFERQGNPWHGDQKISRGKRRKLHPQRPGLPRLLPRESRLECDAVLDLQCKRRIENLIAAETGNGRAVARTETARLPLLNVIRSARDTELTAAQRRLYVEQRAEVRARCAVADRIDERERLRRTIEAATRRLADMDD